MRTSIIREYHQEVKEYFDVLSEEKSEILEGLGVVDDLEGFEKELMMIGLVKLQKDARFSL